MSKLIDRLNRLAKGMPKPMGFRTVSPVSGKVKMLLIASLAQASDVDRLADDITGVDALLIAQMGSGDKTMPKIAQSVPDTPWGLWWGDIGGGRLKPVAEAGCDFVVFPASGALAMPWDDKVGKVLQVEASLSEGLLRTINELPVDAVLAANEPGEESLLTWRHLMLFQRLANLLAKPLLVPVPSSVTARELEVLWKTGVDGVVVTVDIGLPAGRLKELRQAIDGLTLSSRQRPKAAALLPRVAEETGTVAETEEEEEEE